ncbi:MAG: hypothetical protein M1831_006882 [Alyxoria varia]|nr:MAG: hypothetical protein M1831_006882 [Alyxoria varia]
MPSRRSLSTWLLAIVLVSPATLASKKRLPRDNSADRPDDQQFQKLLDQVPQKNLHEALHELHPAFKDGVFEGVRPAAEAVHDEDPALASHVVTTASQMKSLDKRQLGNSTSTPDSYPSNTPTPTNTPSGYQQSSETPDSTASPSSGPSSSTSDLPPYPDSTSSDEPDTTSTGESDTTSTGEPDNTSTGEPDNTSTGEPDNTLTDGPDNTPTDEPSDSDDSDSSQDSPRPSPNGLYSQPSANRATPSSSSSDTSLDESPSPSEPDSSSVASVTAQEPSSYGSTQEPSSDEPRISSNNVAPTSDSSNGGSRNRPRPSPSGDDSSPTNVIVPFSRATTDDEGRQYVTQGQETAAITGQAVVPITTTDENGNRITRSTSVPGLVFQTTDADGNERATTSPLPTAGPIISGDRNRQGDSDVTTTDSNGNTITLTDASPGDVFTITDQDGRVITTTYAGGGGGPVRSLVLQTKTLPNGERSTLTSVAVIVPTVEPGNTPTQEGVTASATGPAPGLVTGNTGVVSRKIGKEAVALVVGAAGVAWLL